jgi:TonB family protein
VHAIVTRLQGKVRQSSPHRPHFKRSARNKISYTQQAGDRPDFSQIRICRSVMGEGINEFKERMEQYRNMFSLSMALESMSASQYHSRTTRSFSMPVAKFVLFQVTLGLAMVLPQSSALGQTSEALPPPKMQSCKGGYQPPVPIRPIGSLITGDDYPTSALRNGEQGTVYVAITVGTNGRAIDVEVISSSATPTLENETIRVIQRRARFMPALKECQAVDGELETSLRWAIP